MPEQLPQYVVLYRSYEDLQSTLNDQGSHGLVPISIFFEPGRGIVIVLKRAQKSLVGQHFKGGTYGKGNNCSSDYRAGSGDDLLR